MLSNLKRLLISWLVLELGSIAAAAARSEQQATQTEVEYIIKYTPSFIRVVFSLDGEIFQLSLEKKYVASSPKVYIVDQPNQSGNRTSRSRSDDCTSYKSSESLMSYYVRVCEGLVHSGVIVREDNYLILQRSRQASPSRLLVEYHNSTIDTHNYIKTLIHHNLTTERHNRWKREDQGNVKVTIRLAIFTEHMLYRKYCDMYSTDTDCTEGEEALTEYVETIVFGADLFYDRISHPQVKISLLLHSIIHNAKSINSVTGDEQSLFHELTEHESATDHLTVDAEKSLDLFSRYQSKHFYNQYGELGIVDYSSLLVLHELNEQDEDEQYITVGITYVAGVCHDGLRASVCQVEPGYTTLYTLAHEIGHFLGADHDGKYDKCPEEDNYLMASHKMDQNLKNIYYFSCCSLAEMYAHIREAGNCLEWIEEMSLVNETHSADQFPGQISDRIGQCEQVFGENYLPCLDQKPERVCLELSCFNEEVSGGKCSTSVDNHMVLPGTECGDRKWCLEGLCVSLDTDTPILEDTSHRPTCDFDLDDFEIVEFTETEEKKKPMQFLSILGRYSSTAVGIICIVVGLACYGGKGYMYRQSRRRRQQAPATMNTLNSPNTGALNADMQNSNPGTYNSNMLGTSAYGANTLGTNAYGTNTLAPNMYNANTFNTPQQNTDTNYNNTYNTIQY